MENFLNLNPESFSIFIDWLIAYLKALFATQSTPNSVAETDIITLGGQIAGVTQPEMEIVYASGLYVFKFTFAGLGVLRFEAFPDGRVYYSEGERENWVLNEIGKAILRSGLIQDYSQLLMSDGGAFFELQGNTGSNPATRPEARHPDRRGALGDSDLIVYKRKHSPEA